MNRILTAAVMCAGMVLATAHMTHANGPTSDSKVLSVYGGTCSAILDHAFYYYPTLNTVSSGGSPSGFASGQCSMTGVVTGVSYIGNSEENAWANITIFGGTGQDYTFYPRLDEYSSGYWCGYNGATQQPC